MEGFHEWNSFKGYNAYNFFSLTEEPCWTSIQENAKPLTTSWTLDSNYNPKMYSKKLGKAPFLHERFQAYKHEHLAQSKCKLRLMLYIISRQ